MAMASWRDVRLAAGRVLCIGAAVACSTANNGGSGTGADAGSDGVAAYGCMPGRSVACVGVGGCSGGQACKEEGSGYGACECSPADGGSDAAAADSGEGGASAPDSGGSDAAAADSGEGGASAADSGRSDGPTSVAGNAQSVRQSAQYNAYPGSDSSSWIVTLSGVQAGDAIYVVGTWPNYASSYPNMGVSDGQGAYTLLDRYDDKTTFLGCIGGTQSLGHWVLQNAVAGTHVINMTPSPETYEDFAAFTAYEIMGVGAILGHTLHFQGSLAPGTDDVTANLTGGSGFVVAATFDDVAADAPTVPLVGSGFTDTGNWWEFCAPNYSMRSESGTHNSVTLSAQESANPEPDYMTAAVLFASTN